MHDTAQDHVSAASVTGAPPAQRHSPTRAWTAVSALTVVATLNVADRILPSILAEPIKHALNLSDAAIGLINGFGFLAVYALIGVPIARLSDRGAYGLVISASVAMWSLMTAICGLCTTGLQLGLARVGVAVGEAGSTPAAHAYIARNFAPADRALPLAVLTLSNPLAGTAALLGGGLLAQALGWRWTFFVMGAVGLVIAPFVLRILGPRQTLAEAQGPAHRPMAGSVRELLGNKSYVALLAGAACIGMGAYALTTFAPAFLVRLHGMSVAEVGWRYGTAYAIVGIPGLLITGKIADRLARRDPRWFIWTVLAMICVLLPFSACAFLLKDAGLAVWAIALANVVSMAWMAPTVAAIQRLARPDQRATASALLLLCSALFGSVGPPVAGAISDALTSAGHAWALGHALLIVPVMQLAGVACYFVAGRHFLQEIKAEESAG